MSLLKRLFGGGDGSKSPSTPADRNAIYYQIRCDKCGEKIRIRVDGQWDLEQQFDGDGDVVSGYIANKEVMGSKCFRMMHMTVCYDQAKRETERQISGGQFITKEEFDQPL